jgi:hypothetical protein
VTKTSRLAAKPLKKVAPSGEKAKTKKRSQRVSFQEAAVGAAASSGEKAKAYADDAAGHTPMVAMRAGEKPAKVLAAETPFFSAQNCSSCTLDQLESATYWLAQIRLAESVGKHWVAAAFFRIAFECQAQVRDKLCDSNSRCNSKRWLRTHVKYYHFSTVSFYFCWFVLV